MRRQYNHANNSIIEIIILLLTYSVCASSQSRSGNVYEFLDMPTTSRMTALGGTHAVLGANDINFVLHNPAALSDTMSNSIGFNFTPLKAGIKSGSVAYSHYVSQLKGSLMLAVQYVNYGTFDETDEEGTNIGTFTAQETALHLTYSRTLSPTFTMAATLKPIFSSLAEYKSCGLAMDMGAYYRASNGRFRAGLVVRNVGAQITNYSGEDVDEKLYTDLRIGISYKAEHAPFRITTTLKDLFHWDLSVDRSNKISFGDNLMRHFIFGVEFVPSEKIFAAFGYNHRLRKENRDSSVGGAAGISWGVGFRIAKIDIAYGMGKYHTAGAANSITLSTNINRFIKTNGR